MKAIVYREYGPPEVLRCEEIDKPTPGDDDVLVRVWASSVNPMDRHFMRGEPYLGRIMTGIGKPKSIRLGVDLAGEVETVGRNVSQFRPGDAVFGAARGAFAEYVCAREDRLAMKPANCSFEQAAAVPTAGLTALQTLRDKGRLQAGQKVLITGAAGGIGHFAVQIAKSVGAQVTGVCSTANVDHVRSIGADQVIDYTREDFTRSSERYDLILTIAGNRAWSAYRRVMTAGGTFVWVGGPAGRWIGPLAGALKTLLLSRFVSRTLVLGVASMKKEDLVALAELMEANKVRPVIGSCYTLTQVSDAIRWLEEGHARGKAVVSLG
jgi:NADPH:quinone reductase-like Zn-dependent oxidoreductase